MRGEIIRLKDQQILEEAILITDPSIFDIFSFHLNKGNFSTALNEPYSIILTKSTVKKYFGDADPIGQTLTIYMNDNTGLGAVYNVTGVMPDAPKNSHFTFNMLASFKTVEIAIQVLLLWMDGVMQVFILIYY